MRFYGLCAVACGVLLAAVSCKEKTVDGTGGTERQYEGPYEMCRIGDIA